MATPSALDTLIELASLATDEAAKRLGIAIKATDKAEKKLALLQQYRNDYAVRLQVKMAQGVTPMHYRNFQAFIEKLDEAIEGQQQLVHDAENGVIREKGVWQASERKRLSYDTLATRALKKDQQRDSKREQKQNDEHAARQEQFKRH
ncbi:MAG TPA: flagellar export protein FliJ [Burkholderiaceae bacterium]|jgi:flagellar FliJ protein|nr:flagellar export protein FliJ [Burkholderiaceae bacterium]